MRKLLFLFGLVMLFLLSPTEFQADVNNKWIAVYYPTIQFKGVAIKSTVNDLNFSWGSKSPHSKIPNNQFSAVFEKQFEMKAGGKYRLSGKSDDGIRIYVDGVLQVDLWKDGAHTFHKDIMLSKGIHKVRVLYFEKKGNASVKVDLKQLIQPIPANQWSALFFPKANFKGKPVQQFTQSLHYAWGANSPHPSIPKDGFTAIFEKDLSVETAGTYRISGNSDDGVRVYVDGVKKIDSWKQGQNSFIKDIPLSKGKHRIKVEYYEFKYTASITLDLNRLTDPDPVPTNKWLAAYYPNVHLTGTPVKQEINQINFAWGNASPNKNIPADNFSAIYQRKYVLNKAGTYILSGVADDGIRVYVNGVKQIDFWTDRIHYFHKELSLPAGTHHIKVEYYERNANSRIELNFEDASSAVPFEKWRASYYPTMNFQGTPIRQIVNQIDYVWETNSPATAVPNDHFSAIFEKRTIINNPGSYILSGNADDGIRIYIDGVKLVDLWTKGAKPFNEEVNLSTGIHHIKVEYYDQTGNAQLKVHLAVKGKNSRVIYSDYDITLNEAIDKQLNVSSTKPQTDKKYKVYVRSDGIELDPKNLSEGKAIKLYNVRGGPGTNYWSLGVLNLNEKVTILNTVKAEDGFDWYEVSFNRQWVNAAKSDVAYYMDPSNFKPGTASFYQFLKLSQFNGLNAAEVNEKILKGKGILEGRAQSFIQAGFLYNINEIYLIAHALLETGNGKSELASGVKVKKKIDREGKYVVNENGEFEIEILESDSKDFDAIVYNMYGIGAYDNCPLQCGARTAFNKGWFTPNQAIIGGAQFVADRYIYKGQDTLYKMRWNPTQPATHQYATDIGWAIKQTPRIYDLYNLLDNYNIDFDVPRYK